MKADLQFRIEHANKTACYHHTCEGYSYFGEYNESPGRPQTRQIHLYFPKAFRDIYTLPVLIPVKLGLRDATAHNYWSKTLNGPVFVLASEPRIEQNYRFIHNCVDDLHTGATSTRCRYFDRAKAIVIGADPSAVDGETATEASGFSGAAAPTSLRTDASTGSATSTVDRNAAANAALVSDIEQRLQAELLKKMAERQASNAGSGSAAASRDAAQTANIVRKADAIADVVSSFQAAISAERDWKKLIALISANREKRLEAGAPDVVGFSAPLRPLPTEVVIPTISATVERYGFHINLGAYGRDGQASASPGWGAYETPAFDGARRPMWVFFNFKLVFPKLNADQMVQLTCRHYGRDGQVLGTTDRNYKFRKRWKNLVWQSGFVRQHWEPGAYGVECDANGKPFINATYDIGG